MRLSRRRRGQGAHAVGGRAGRLHVPQGRKVLHGLDHDALQPRNPRHGLAGPRQLEDGELLLPDGRKPSLRQAGERRERLRLRDFCLLDKVQRVGRILLRHQRQREDRRHVSFQDEGSGEGRLGVPSPEEEPVRRVHLGGGRTLLGLRHGAGQAVQGAPYGNEAGLLRLRRRRHDNARQRHRLRWRRGARRRRAGDEAQRLVLHRQHLLARGELPHRGSPPLTLNARTMGGTSRLPACRNRPGVIHRHSRR